MLRDFRDAWSWIQKLVHRIERLESGASLENSSITEGRMRFIGGLLLIDSGGLLEIVGSLSGAGSFVWAGPWELTGAGEITGDVAQTGDVNLTGDLNVTGTGRVKAGVMVIDPTANGGSIKFGGGPEVYADGSTLNLYSSATGAWIELDGTRAKVVGPGTKWIEISSTNVTIVGLPTKTASSTGLPVGVVHADSTGKLFRIV